MTEQKTLKCQLSNEKTLVGYVIQGIILPNYMRIIISHYKDPYKPTSIMESDIFFFVAQFELGKSGRDTKFGGVDGTWWNLTALIFFGGELRSVRDNYTWKRVRFFCSGFFQAEKTAPMKNPWDVCIFTYIKTNIYHKNQPFSVGKYTVRPMDGGMGRMLILGAPKNPRCRISENCWSVADRPRRRGWRPQWAMTAWILAVRVCSIAEAVLQDIGLHIIICEYVSISENIVIWLFIIGEGCYGISQVHGIRHPVLQCSCFTIQRSIWNSTVAYSSLAAPASSNEIKAALFRLTEPGTNSPKMTPFACSLQPALWPKNWAWHHTGWFPTRLEWCAKQKV